MRLVALAPMMSGGVQVAVGGEFEVDDHSGAKLVARGHAKAKGRAPRKTKKAETPDPVES